MGPTAYHHVCSPQATEGGFVMSVSTSEGFLSEYRIKIPEPSALAVFHAEAVTHIPGQCFTFSETARSLIRDLISESGHTVNLFVRKLASDSDAHHHSIIIFLDGPYQMAEHIWSIRSSIEEIAMFSCITPSTDGIDVPPVGGLFIADVETLTDLATRSPFLGQLLTIVDGPPDEAIWAYFLGKAESKQEEADEGVSVPVKRLEPIAD
jgi:hypothetical protein